MKTKFKFILQTIKIQIRRTNNKTVTKTMCQDKNEVIGYYRYINIPG